MIDIEQEIEESRKTIASAETTIALYAEQINEYKESLKKEGIETDNLAEELHKMKRRIDRLQKQEDSQLRKAAGILDEIDKETSR